MNFISPMNVALVLLPGIALASLVVSVLLALHAKRQDRLFMVQLRNRRYKSRTPAEIDNELPIAPVCEQARRSQQEIAEPRSNFAKEPRSGDEEPGEK